MMRGNFMALAGAATLLFGKWPLFQHTDVSMAGWMPLPSR